MAHHTHFNIILGPSGRRSASMSHSIFAFDFSFWFIFHPIFLISFPPGRKLHDSKRVKVPPTHVPRIPWQKVYAYVQGTLRLVGVFSGSLSFYFLVVVIVVYSLHTWFYFHLLLPTSLPLASWQHGLHRHARWLAASKENKKARHDT